MGQTGMKKDEDVIRGVAEYEGNYLSLDKDRLVLFAVGLLESKKIEPTFDKIVVTTFRLFPKKFSLIGFAEYPDGRTIYYCAYNHCTLDKKWLFGNVQSGFKVTERGKYFLDETKKMLEGKILLTRTHQVIARRKETTFITILKKTNAYKKYVQSKKEAIGRAEILEALMLPPNSKSLIQTHLKKYLEYANRVNDSSVVEFLRFAEGKLKGDNNA
jgi:hypothetical protein